MTDYDAWKTNLPEADELHNLAVERFNDDALKVAKQVMALWPANVQPAGDDDEECEEEVNGPLINYYRWWLANERREDGEAARLEFRFMVASDAADLFADSELDVTENW